MNKITRFADVELRSADETSNIVDGVACVFGQTADLGWFTEEIDRNAFDECDMSDVVLNLNHDNNFLLARTTNGSLRLSIDDVGLHQNSNIVETNTGKDVLTLVRKQLISKMSFAFIIANDGEKWVDTGEKPHRIITKIERLFDVSLVTFPAYSQTSVSARNMDGLAEKHLQYLETLQKQKEKMEGIINDFKM